MNLIFNDKPINIIFCRNYIMVVLLIIIYYKFKLYKYIDFYRNKYVKMLWLEIFVDVSY